MIVSRYRDAQLASLLIDAGANVNAKNAQEESPILLATHREDDERDNIIKLLAEHGADVNTKDKASWTPLMHAARYHDAQFVKLLIDVGADVHATNDDGATTAIFMAICNFTEKRYDIIQVLVDHGADVNVTVYDDMTPLRFVTLLCPDKRLIELLVSLGAK
jgi:ankyrin repeat protein